MRELADSINATYGQPLKFIETKTGSFVPSENTRYGDLVLEASENMKPLESWHLVEIARVDHSHRDQNDFSGAP